MREREREPRLSSYPSMCPRLPPSFSLSLSLSLSLTEVKNGCSLFLPFPLPSSSSSSIIPFYFPRFPLSYFVITLRLFNFFSLFSLCVFISQDRFIGGVPPCDLDKNTHTLRALQARMNFLTASASGNARGT